MDLHLKDKVVIVTGGSSGIGEAITRLLAVEGAIPVIASRNTDRNETLLAELKSKNQNAFAFAGELSDAFFCERIVSETLARFGRIDALVNNAGRNDGVGLANGNPASFAQSVIENLGHYYYLAHFALPSLKEAKGSIVNISSKVAMTGQGGTSGYAAAKAAQLGLTREWAAELLPFGIRVNAILPAEVMTPLYESWINTFEKPSEKLASIVSKIPLEQRMTTSAEIASATVFLLSAQASHITGQWWVIDGGYVHLDRALT
ncbi:MAG: SDR family oxidoreductase [Bacteroidetes bacterium]|nr:SDR family oxidoreductase [Bacteroidota bacterium]